MIFISSVIWLLLWQDVEVKWVEYQNMVNYLMQWIRHHVTIMSDRTFPNNPVELKVRCGGLDSLLESQFILLTQSILEQMTCLLIYTIISIVEQYYSLTFSKYNRYITSIQTIKSESLPCH